MSDQRSTFRMSLISGSPGSGSRAGVGGAVSKEAEADAEHPDVLADADTGWGGPDAVRLVQGGGAQVHRREGGGERGEGGTGHGVRHHRGEERRTGGDLGGGQ